MTTHSYVSFLRDDIASQQVECYTISTFTRVFL